MKRYIESFANKESFVQAIKIGLVGVFNTVVSLSLFNVFLVLLDWNWFMSITVVFISTTFMSYLINRRWTFELKDGKVSGHETAKFFAINIGAYFATIAFMWVAEELFGPLSAIGYNIALILVAGLLILPKLAGYRDVVFSKALSDTEVPEETPA